MALIDLKSDLLNIKFGNDRPGYGSSNLPYIQTQIPDAPNSPGLFRPIFIPGSTGTPDFPIRGGTRGSVSVGFQTFTLSSQIDKTRIEKFFKDEQRGPIFLRKQVGLQLTNPKIETGNTLFGLGQSRPLPGLIENTRVYDPTGRLTLAQVAAMGSGAHAIRSGLVAFAPTQKHYFDIVNQQNVNNIKSINRLVNLNALKMSTGVSPFVNPENVIDYERVSTLGISLNRNLLFQYLGGPGSVYGAGTTTIKRSVDTTKLRSTTSMTYDQLKVQKDNTQNIIVSNANNTPQITWLGKTTYKTNDFRIGLDGVDGSYVPWENPATGKNDKVETRFYVSPGNYKDKLNSSWPFVFNNIQAPWEVESESPDDLIKFVFECISNDDPNYSLAIFFRAFLTAGITDNHSAQLNSFRYMGRGENFYTYQGFERSIGFSFRMAAGSKEELIPMYNRLNSLVSQVYPDYSDANIMRAPVVRLTIGDYLYRMPGLLESVNITVDNSYPWEINLDGDSAQLPQVIDVQVQFKPILEYLPKRASIFQIKDRALNTDLSAGTTNALLSAEYGNMPIITSADVIDIIRDPIVKGIRPSTAQEYRNRKLELAASQTTAAAAEKTRQQNLKGASFASGLESLKTTKPVLDTSLLTKNSQQKNQQKLSPVDFKLQANAQSFEPPEISKPIVNTSGKIPGG